MVNKSKNNSNTVKNTINIRVNKRFTPTVFVFFIMLFVISCGDNSSNSSNPCDSNPCAQSQIAHKIVCEMVTNNDFTCVCEYGYELQDGICKEIELNPCDIEPCTKEHQISCTATGTTVNDYICNCEEGYHIKDDSCVETINPCDPNPCVETFKTACTANSQTAGDFLCSCDEGYSEDTEGICQKLNDFNLRLVAANITSGNTQSYDWGDGVRIFQAIKADVIMIQELNYKDNKASDYKELAGKIFNDPNCVDEARCYYYSGSGQIPNGILSKYKILSRGYWNDPEISNRDLNYTTIDLPGGVDLFVISVHLSTSGSKQTRPASIIAQNVADHKIANPGKFYYAVGGDFNGTTAVKTSGFGKENAFNIQDLFPKSKSGNYDTNASRAKHYDWILESSNLSDLQISSKFCDSNNENDCLSYPDGLVMDTREYTSTEINKYFSPARLEDSGAINMQHMAIVKDFKITIK